MTEQIIGLTTTACAKHMKMLQKIPIKVVITEEAGEVLEAHTINALLPTIEHAIFIGDPLQLRPLVEEPVLSLETILGEKYRLDESLFERLAMPRKANSPRIPISVLNLQRRMHPNIADLCRNTLYPGLIVSSHPF